MKQAARNLQTLAILVGIVAGMVGLAFASVPLYRLFCQITGYEGTTQRAQEVPIEISNREVTVFFSADLANNMPWRFYPETGRLKVRVGETANIVYIAENLSDRTIIGHATYNVSPDLFGPYFSKVECFCFQEQTLKPGEKVRMPVVFFLDPEMLRDKNLNKMGEVTLAYTFFERPNVGNESQPVN